jgi:hypothetical protein
MILLYNNILKLWVIDGVTLNPILSTYREQYVGIYHLVTPRFNEGAALLSSSIYHLFKTSHQIAVFDVMF